MRTGRPTVAIVLTEAEQQHLESMARRSRTAPQLARRARIVPDCAAGQNNKAVARRLRLPAATVGKWRTRFAQDGVDGLLDFGSVAEARWSKTATSICWWWRARALAMRGTPDQLGVAAAERGL